MFVLLTLLELSCGFKIYHHLKKLPEENMQTPELIRYYGYPCEIHNVTTEDGYILSLHRIPHGRKSRQSKNYPVFLQHGILDSSATFAMNLPHQSLAFILADEGYDVWLGNSRGNTYSRSHVKYTVKDAKFWDFSFDEMAKYDLPASINYVLKISKTKDLYYVGHSQGTTIGFAEFSQNKKLAEKIRTFFGLAPVATVGHIKGAIKYLSYFSTEAKFLIKLLGINEFLPSDFFTKFIGEKVCGSFHIFEESCSNVVFLIAGFDKKELNESRVPVYLSHLPAGTSVKDLLHFSQLVKSKQFQMYNYGSTGNVQKYGQKNPPQYNITQMNVPVALYYGGKDWLADPTDVEGSLLPNLPHLIDVLKRETWDHLDFVWGIDANRYVYDDVLKKMRFKLNY